MLTMTTLLISVLTKLPPTPYIKWIEHWLIFAQLVPLVQVVLITSIQWLMENDENKTLRGKEEEKFDRILINDKLVWVKSVSSFLLWSLLDAHKIILIKNIAKGTTDQGTDNQVL